MEKYMSIKFTGIPDEGADLLSGQLALHRELGWDSMEIRSVEGKNICEMPEEDFNRIYEVLNEENIQVVGFASSIANWARPITGDFSLDTQDLLRAAPRMRRMHTPYLRIMSYTQGERNPEQWADESISRVKELSRMAEGEGIVLVHENCDGWASSEPERLERLLESVQSPALKVVFDMGNPLSHGHPEEKVWDFLKACGDRIAHVHIKDCYMNDAGEAVHCLPGEGQCHVQPIVRHLVANQNYSGYVSIEPHMVFQFHEGMDDSADGDVRKAHNYLEYGKKTMELFSSREFL